MRAEGDATTIRGRQRQRCRPCASTTTRNRWGRRTSVSRGSPPPALRLRRYARPAARSSLSSAACSSRHTRCTRRSASCAVGSPSTSPSTPAPSSPPAASPDECAASWPSSPSLATTPLQLAVLSSSLLRRPLLPAPEPPPPRPHINDRSSVPTPLAGSRSERDAARARSWGVLPPLVRPLPPLVRPLPPPPPPRRQALRVSTSTWLSGRHACRRVFRRGGEGLCVRGGRWMGAWRG
eukprot:350866-Chlamydomonas_euryale.AAC.5